MVDSMEEGMVESMGDKGNRLKFQRHSPCSWMEPLDKNLQYAY